MQDILAEIAAESWLSRTANVTVSKAYRHILTHQVIYCRFINIRVRKASPAPDSNLAFYTPDQIARLPKPALISRFLDEQKTR